MFEIIARLSYVLSPVNEIQVVCEMPLNALTARDSNPLQMVRSHCSSVNVFRYTI